MLPSVAAQGGSDGVKPSLLNSLCVEKLLIREALALTLPVLSPEEARERLKIAILGLQFVPHWTRLAVFALQELVSGRE